MKNEITLQTRREFLRTTVLGSALSWTVPAFLADTFAALHGEAADSATQIITGKDATILVVLQMAGGNDGLNTVVPFANDFYHRARPKLGLSAQQILNLNGEIGLARRHDRVQGTFTMPATWPWCRASAIQTRTARISARRKSGRPPATRTRSRNTAGSGVISTIAVPAPTRPWA